MIGQPSIKFLIDESVEYQIILFLKRLGFDVVAITEESPSISDLEVLELSYQERRILITNDKGFGDLVFKEKLPSWGIILIRLPFSNIEEKNKMLKHLLDSKSKRLDKLLVTITLSGTRVKVLPNWEKKYGSN